MFSSSPKGAQRKTVQYGSRISSRSAVGAPIGDKNTANPRLLLSAHRQWRPGATGEAVFIDFHRFSLISEGFEAIFGQKVGQPVAGCGGLWQPVATCGGIILAL